MHQKKTLTLSFWIFSLLVVCPSFQNFQDSKNKKLSPSEVTYAALVSACAEAVSELPFGFFWGGRNRHEFQLPSG